MNRIHIHIPLNWWIACNMDRNILNVQQCFVPFGLLSLSSVYSFIVIVFSRVNSFVDYIHFFFSLVCFLWNFVNVIFLFGCFVVDFIFYLNFMLFSMQCDSRLLHLVLKSIVDKAAFWCRIGLSPKIDLIKPKKSKEKNKILVHQHHWKEVQIRDTYKQPRTQNKEWFF